MPRSACHFSARCRVFRVALRSKLTRFEMLFVPHSAFFTRFLVLRGTRGVCFTDFSQLLPLEPFDSKLSLPRTCLGAFPGAQARFETGKIKLRPRASSTAIQNAAGPPGRPLNNSRGPRDRGTPGRVSYVEPGVGGDEGEGGGGGRERERERDKRLTRRTNSVLRRGR